MNLLLLFSCASHDPGPHDKVGDETVWSIEFGGGGADEAWGLDLTDDGDLILGTLQSENLPDAWMYRVSPSGELLWESQWGTDGSDMVYIVEVSGNVAYVGGASFTGAWTDSADAFVLAVDIVSGEVLWTWTWDGGHGYEEIDGIVVDDDGIYVSGWTTGESTSNDLLLAKLSLDGETEWATGWGGEGWDEGDGHLVGIGDVLYVAGRVDGEGLLAGGDAFVGAFSKADGSNVWEWTDGGPDTMEDALGLATDGVGLYAVGMVQNGLSVDLSAWSLDLDGNLLASATASGMTSRSLSALPDGSWLVPANGSEDMIFLRWEGDTFEELGRWGGEGHDEVHDVVVDGNSAWFAGQTGEENAVLIHAALEPFTLP